ncbi:unnamed protein product (macronuclear) [Paramecium tetraurelia]|uniref:Uncharacterized protein n=1 Tax=Paramecium tetraurelia TaxID=5888 RepID=A0DH13_PARTE|nr:uncharacterized protein GSPATT00002459001 [Paramecium tetraurelia]CAK82330.1 unnamed protein product [Paramecium tetraurelia]|eukprot:XP_001449727.1 hypothetical protein (macronuclear) [Paramecium tetraurelia strain d4-2]
MGLSPLVCGDVTEEKDCLDIINGIYLCKWTTNGCVNMKCELVKPPCDQLIYENKACSTSGTNCVSVSECSEIDNQSSCGVVKAGGRDCIWDTLCRMKQCSDYDQANCKVSNDDNCVFKDGTCQKLVFCTDIVTKDLCQTIDLADQCAWINDKCDIFDCKKFTNSEECFSAVSKTDSCFNGAVDNTVNCMSCFSLKNQCDCQQYGLYGCKWDTQTGGCIRQKCEDFEDTITCQQAFDGLTCVWYKPMDQCKSIANANELDRQCDLYVFSQTLTFGLLVSLIIYI